MRTDAHGYIERETSRVRLERFVADGALALAYGPVLQHAPALLRLLVAPWTSRWLAHLGYDLPRGAGDARRFARAMGVDLSECVMPERLVSRRDVFERRIRYWECRPMPADPAVVVSPADARVIVGSLAATAPLVLKCTLFDLDDLLGPQRPDWRATFRDGDVAVFRLTPDKYHYNHVPLSGRVLDVYEVDGDYHSCNPGVAVRIARPLSRNRRVVTVLDTDVPGGAGAGLVAMVEVVALMVGDVVPCYSRVAYDAPRPVTPGMFLERGQPKSLYRPGSSTDVVLFQRDRIAFCADLIANTLRQDVPSRLSRGLGRSLVETEVKVRSPIARVRAAGSGPSGEGRHGK